jgi:ribosomal protein S18 acetylase RimI-like enzyme
MTNRRTVVIGDDRFVVVPWHADPSIALLTVSGRPRPRPGNVRRVLDALAGDGFVDVITPALHLDEAGTLIGLGFEEFDRLKVLGHDLVDLDPPRPTPDPAVRLHRARRRDHPAALEVDAAAFPSFWQLDRSGLHDALRATPRHRFRIASCDHGVVGYAVTGRAGSQGFLQRLAVRPALGGRGLGSSLVIDALHWAARRRVARLLVNTQEDNHRALDLYHRLGFELTPTDLVVLRRPLT